MPADAIAQWDLMEPGVRIKDYKKPKSEYLRNVWELNTNRRDIDPG